MQRRGLRAGGAHLNNTLTGGGDVGVFLAELAVGEDLYFIFAVGKFRQIFAELMHADGFRLAFRLHARDFDHGFGIGRRRHAQRHAADEAECHKERNNAFHQRSSCWFGILICSRTYPALAVSGALRRPADVRHDTTVPLQPPNRRRPAPSVRARRWACPHAVLDAPVIRRYPLG